MSAPPTPDRSGSVFEAVFRVELFRALDDRGRADVRASGGLRHFAPGAPIVHAGGPADTLLVVARGRVRLEPASGRSALASGREIRAGELFGHEALVPFAVRPARALAVEPTSIVELPVGVLERALVRAGFPELLVREEARARRAEWLGLLARTALGGLPAGELAALSRTLIEEPRVGGEALDSAGARGDAVWLVAGGLFERRPSTEAGAPARPVYAARGDFIGLVPPRTRAAPPLWVALGNALALGIPRETFDRVAARHPDALSALERVTSAREVKQRRTLEAVRSAATRHATNEMERLVSASSLLAIDLERCTRCGHCTAVCADTHGSARLERRGEKIVVALRVLDAVVTVPLLFPGACQHCREPACLEPCPTGAIRRLATGAVELDGDLCTGCGACAKACPWDAIRMAPRPEAAKTPALVARSAEVAVKCDLCRGHDGPQCVSACPTDAIVRLDPARDVVEVRAALGKKADGFFPGRSRPRLLVSAFVVFGLVPPFVALERTLAGAAGEGVRFAAGAFAALLVVVLTGHAVVKRVGRVRRWARRALSRSGAVSTVAPFVTFHAVTGGLAAACVFLHSGFAAPRGLLGALAVSFWSVAASGVFGAVAYRVLPERLSRIERRSGLPEDEPEEREALLDRLHAAVSGANPAKKELVRRLLLPYAAAWAGTVSLVFRGRTLGAEEAALGVRLERVLGGRKSERLAGIEELVRTAVEMRALRARRWLRALLRAWLPFHLLLSAGVLVLLALHVAGALR